MNNQERRDKEILYITDDAIMEEQAVARRLCQKLNTMDRSDFKGLQAVVKELLGKSDNAWINPPFYCDYGKNIEVGKNFFANYNCTILDVAKVVIGDNCQIAPNVSIYTGIGITIGDNVWIGGDCVIWPGVHIGDNAVIGAGSVVIKDIPAWSVAAGNPCKVIRKITEVDRYRYFTGIPVDDEAKAHMQRMWAKSTDPVKFPSAEGDIV